MSRTKYAPQIRDLLRIAGEGGCFPGVARRSRSSLSTTTGASFLGGGEPVGDGQPEIANLLTHIFGTAACTACGADFCVADQV